MEIAVGFLLTNERRSGEGYDVIRLGGTEHDRVDVRLVVHSSAVDEELEASGK